MASLRSRKGEVKGEAKEEVKGRPKEGGRGQISLLNTSLKIIMHQHVREAYRGLLEAVTETL